MPQTIAPRVLSWASDIEPDTVEQAARAAAMPFVVGHVALMPDAHLGLGATVGSVIPTLGAIIPAAVGVDIGCGMIAVQTDLVPEDLDDNRLRSVLSRVKQTVPAGVGQGHEHYGRGEAWLVTHPNDSVSRFLGEAWLVTHPNHSVSR